MVNIGIIGAGRIGKAHLEGICTGVRRARVKTVADPFMNAATEARIAEFGDIRVTNDYTEILRDPEINAVLVCSSTDTHADISVEAIRAGKHVFCEKPVDHGVAKIKKVAEALDGTGLKFAVGFNRRFDHNFKALRDAVSSGKIGTPQIIRVTSRDPEPPSPEYVKVSGGIFLDMTIHDFDMVRYLAGCDAVSVYAQSAALVDSAIGEAGDADTAVITVAMENGAIATIDNSRKAVYGYDQRAEVFGSAGMVASSNDTSSTAVLSNADGITGEKPLYFFLERYMEAFREEIRQFITSIEEDKATAVGVNDGLQAVRMALAAKLSAKERRPVFLSEIEG